MGCYDNTRKREFREKELFSVPNYTEGVGEFQPRVCFDTLGYGECWLKCNSEGVAKAFD